MTTDEQSREEILRIVSLLAGIWMIKEFSATLAKSGQPITLQAAASECLNYLKGEKS